MPVAVSGLGPRGEGTASPTGTPQLLLPGATPVISAWRRFEQRAVSALTFQQNQRRP